MDEQFTVFDQHGRSSPASEPPAVGSGLSWVRGSYSGNVHPSPYEMRVGSGMHAWFVIAELENQRGEYDAVVRTYDGQITCADLDAAVRHYFRYKEDIDARIAEHHAPIT